MKYLSPNPQTAKHLPISKLIIIHIQKFKNMVHTTNDDRKIMIELNSDIE